MSSCVEVRVGNIIGFVIKAALFDFGGVVTTSPFEGFARYEAANDLPDGLIRSINSTNPDSNAWAKLERSDVDTAGFAELFEQEALDRGHRVDGRLILEQLSGQVRPQVVEAIQRIKDAGFITACLTNNFRSHDDGDSNIAGPGAAGADTDTDTGEARRATVMTMFDKVVESSVVGIRKPEPEFYRQALSIVGVEANEAVFIDDLGINLKPARAMGITTIKVEDPDVALRELGAVLGLSLLD